MKSLFGVIFAFFVIVSTGYGAGGIADLWKPKTQKKHKKSYKDLWSKSKQKANTKKNKKYNTADKIKNSETILQQTSSMQKEMSQQLDKIARSIQRETLESVAINKVLRRLKKELKQNETQYDKAQNTISQYGSKIKKLGKNISIRHQAYVKLLSDQFALVLAMRTQGGNSVDAIIRHEAYEALKKKNTEQLLKLKMEIEGSNKEKKKLLFKQNKIKQSISSLRAKRDLYDRKKAEKKALLKKLAKKEDQYRAKLKEIMQSQKALRQTLAKLNIIRKKEIEEAKRAEQARKEELNRRIAQRKQEQNERLSADSSAIDSGTFASSAANSVKQYGSSYQANNIQAYRGMRTISPLKQARLAKKFGTYIDPIYKIKIFNDNIVLRSPNIGAKVRNVLNGKVVYVGKNSMLGKVIIVEHGNRLHTIYAALDKISPMLHVGSRVKKGVIIGRIKHKLIFQATQNSKYINPLRLIKL